MFWRIFIKQWFNVLMIYLSLRSIPYNIDNDDDKDENYSNHDYGSIIDNSNNDNNSIDISNNNDN